MNSIEKMLEQLCSCGVPYVKLQDCCFLEKGNTPIQKAIPGEYPLVVTTAERKSANVYQFSEPTVCVPLVSSRGHGVASLNQIYYQEGKFALGNILCGVTPKDRKVLSAKYLYYYLNLKKDSLIVPLMKGGANVSLTVNSLKTVKVALPPFQVQQEIILRLQKFEELLEALDEQQVLRNRQYDYYSDFVFSNLSGVDMVALSDLVQIRTGKLDANARTEDGEYPFFTCDAKPYRINKYAFDTEAILVSGNGSQIGHVNYYKGKFNAYQRTYVFTDFNGVEAQYLLMYLKRYIRQYCKSNSKKGSVPYITLPMLQKFMVPVPQKSVQMNIVEKLRKFERLCSDEVEGLPAEIMIRKKQYDYFRDKLLTFKET